MRKNQFVAFLCVMALFFVYGAVSGHADDASDTMEALLKAQLEAESSKSQAADVSSPVAVQAVAQAVVSTPEPVAPVTATAEAQVSIPAETVSADASAPVKARDVLTHEEKKLAEPVSGEDESAVDEGGEAKSKTSVLEDAAKSGKIMVADFDSGDKPNNLGGDFGAWDKDPNDDTQTCRATYASDDSTGNMEGFALRVDYDVNSPNPAYNGFWMKLENLNATPYDTLSFYVRGASHRFTKRLKVELKTPDSRSSSFIVSGISDQWQKIQIPLKRFKGVKDWSVMGELILVFDDVNTAPKKGTLLIDQIMFERLENGMPQKKSKETGYLLSDNQGPEERISKE